MTATAAAPLATDVRRPLTQTSTSRGRRARNGLATTLMYLAVVIVAIPLGAIVFYVVSRGGRVVDLGFLQERIPPLRAEGGGMHPAIIGTLLITGAASAMAIPLGILAAVYITEYGAGRRLAGAVRFMADVMAGVPSIVMGLFVYTVWVLRFQEQTAFAGALALAALMLPVVIRATESMLALVPRETREASYALGCRKSRTILTVVLPAALAGITSGCLLAVARAAGETAPLLFTIGIVSTTNPNLFQGTNTALSAQIFRNASQPFAGAQDRAWGAALTLIALVLVLTVVARIVSRRFATR